MKKIALFLITLIISSPLLALRGVCYTFGRDPRSSSPYNYQQKYYVDCDCDCAKTVKQCPECGHYHDVPEEIIVSPHNGPHTNRITTPPTQEQAYSYIISKAVEQKKNAS